MPSGMGDFLFQLKRIGEVLEQSTSGTTHRGDDQLVALAPPEEDDIVGNDILPEGKGLCDPVEHREIIPKGDPLGRDLPGLKVGEIALEVFPFGKPIRDPVWIVLHLYFIGGVFIKLNTGIYAHVPAVLRLQRTGAIGSKIRGALQLGKAGGSCKQEE